MSPLGPLFRYELTRLARRGLQPRFRAAFAGLLLVVLFLSYLAAFPKATPRQVLTHLDTPLSLEASSRFGARFLVTFLYVQACVVVLITPAIAAGALGEDKARGALDLLLTTALTSWEIIAGKLLARLVFVGSLLLTGLPVVALVILFGGVDIQQLIVGYGIALLTILSIGAASLCMSLGKPTLEDAIFGSYLWVLTVVMFGAVAWALPILMAFSPFGTLYVMFEGWPRTRAALPNPANPWGLLAIYAAVHLLLTSILCCIAVRMLRTSLDRARGDAVPDNSILDSLSPEIREILLAIPSTPRTRTVPPVDDANPLGWKDRYFGGFMIDPPSSAVLFLPLMFVIVLLLLILQRYRGAEAFVGVLRFFSTLGSLIGIIVVGLKATNSIAHERQNGTLDSLLTIPLSRRHLVWSKARAALHLASWPAVMIVVGFLAGSMQVGLSFLELAIPVVFVGWLVATIGFGLWLSVRCATHERALAWYFGIGFIVCIIVPMTGVLVQDGSDAGSVMWSYFVKGLSPLVGLANASPLSWDRRSPREDDQMASYGAMLGAFVAASIGVFLGSRAVRRFERND